MQRVKWHRKEKKLPLKAASNSSYLNQGLNEAFDSYCADMELNNGILTNSRF